MRKICRLLTLLAVFSCGLGARFLSFSTPVGNISIFRMSLFLCMFFMLIWAEGSKNLVLFYKENKYIVITGIIWFAYAILTCFWSKDNLAWGQAVFFLLIYLLLLSVLNNNIVNESDYFLSLKVFNAGALMQACIGAYEYMTGNYHFKSMSEKDYWYLVTLNKRVPLAMCWSENEFATLMFFASICSLFFLLYEKRKRKKAFYFFCNCLYGILIFLSTSRAVLLGIIILLAVVILLYGYKGWGIGLAVFSVILFFSPVQAWVAKFLAFDFLSGNNSESVRISLIKNGIYFLKSSFGCGIGAGQAQYWLEKYSIYNVNGVYDMHNWWIQILSEYGIVIFTIYIISYAKMFRHYFRRRKGSNIVCCTFSRVMCGALCGFIVTGISSSSVFRNEAMWTFFALTAAGMCVMNKDPKGRLSAVYMR